MNAFSAQAPRQASTRRTRHPILRAAQRGLSMVELSLVLIVIAVVLAGVYWGFSNSQRRVEIDENVAVISEIISTMQSKFGKTNTYGDVTTAIAVRTGAIPNNLRIPNTNTAQNSYGGLIAVAPVNCVGTNDCVDLTWPSVPRAQCSEVVIGMSRAARRITVEGTAVKPLDGLLNLATLTNMCDADGGKAVVITIGRGA